MIAFLSILTHLRYPLRFLHPAPLLTLLAVTLLGLAIASPDLGTADAQARIRAQVFLTQARIPQGLDERGLLRFARGNRTARLQEVTDRPLAERDWRANLVVKFSRALGDLEFHVLFYDVHDGPRRFVDDLATYVGDRNQRTFVQRIRLRRPRYQPNRNMEGVITVRRQEVATFRFGIVGEEVQRSGEVDFTGSDDDE